MAKAVRRDSRTPFPLDRPRRARKNGGVLEKWKDDLLFDAQIKLWTALREANPWARGGADFRGVHAVAPLHVPGRRAHVLGVRVVREDAELGR